MPEQKENMNCNDHRPRMYKVGREGVPAGHRKEGVPPGHVPVWGMGVPPDHVTVLGRWKVGYPLVMSPSGENPSPRPQDRTWSDRTSTPCEQTKQTENITFPRPRFIMHM